MPVDKKQHTTLPTEPPTTSPLSSPQAFHQQLRDQIRTAVQTVMEEIMREELTQFLGAEWGECTKTRRGYRNGTYTRSLSTSSGPIEELHVPWDREGQFHTQAFDRYSRYEPQVAEGRDGDVRGRSLDRESRVNDRVYLRQDKIDRPPIWRYSQEHEVHHAPRRQPCSGVRP